MYITSLTLKDVKCFRDLHLDFTVPETGKPRKWTVLLGENGVGKSTILQTIGLCLAGSDAAGEWLYRRPEWSVVRQGAGRGQVDVQVVGGRHDEGGPGPWGATLGLSPSGGPLKDLSAKPTPLGTQAGSRAGWFVCGYGAGRRLPSAETVWEPLKGRERAERIASLVSDNASLRPISHWLQRAHYEALTEQVSRRRTGGEARLRAMKRAVRALLPEVTAVDVGPDRVNCRTPFGLIAPEALSDGYRGMLAWAMDLLGHLSDAFPEGNDPLSCEGVVLIDEIDAHLHPAWQRDVIFRVRKLFPNLQFVVSTHSPLAAQAAEAGEVVVLRRRGKEVVAEGELDSVRGWTADQVLQSELFGLESTRDPMTADMLARRRELLAKGRLTTDERADLERLSRLLAQALPPPGGTPEERREIRERRGIRRQLLERISREDLAKIRAQAAADLKRPTSARKPEAR